MKYVFRCSGIVVRGKLPHPIHQAFTLVELLVVITIIGILIALLLPAVQAAREAARRVQCCNQFKQVGLALHNYHSVYECFPPGNTQWNGYVSTAECGEFPGTQYYCGFGWAALILPFHEGENLFDTFDFSGQMTWFTDSDPVNVENCIVAGTKLGIYICPSDPQGDELVSRTGGGHMPGATSDYEDNGRSNMAGVIDSRSATCASSYINYFRLFKADGIMANVDSCKIVDISDGTSNTLMIGEVTGRGPGSHVGFYWASHDVASTVGGINSAPNSIPGECPYSAGRGCGFSSFHPGGAHFTLADGSVQFISENIDAETLKRLTTRAGGDVVMGGAY